MDKMEMYLDWLDRIMIKNSLDGGFLHSTFIRGIENKDLTPCYIDSRVKNGSKARKELKVLISEYLTDFPEAKKPLYSWE